MSIKSKLEKVPVTQDLFRGLSNSEIKTGDILAQIALQILNYRKEHSLSQKELAEQLGVSQALVSRWERAEHNFTIENLVRNFDKLGIEVDLAFDKQIKSKFERKITPPIGLFVINTPLKSSFDVGEYVLQGA